MSSDPALRYQEEGRHLAGAIDAALPWWVESVLGSRVPDLEPDAVSDVVGAVVDRAVPGLYELLSADIDDQRDTPLGVLRRSTSPITRALDAAGVVPPPRDPVEARIWPDDPYGIGPRSWEELGDDVAHAALRWGAAKAFVHRHRHGG